MRLNRAIASSGLCSRRKAEEIILSGRVSINGKMVMDLSTTICDEDIIHIDNKPIEKEAKQYFLLHKPIGYTCSHQRKNKEKLVFDLFPAVNARLFCVGRLDKNTTGLLLITNDGKWAQKVIHPSNNIIKEYEVTPYSVVTNSQIKKVKRGAFVEGIKVIPKKVYLQQNKLIIQVAEGKKHEVRILCKFAGIDQIKLKRIRIGPLHLGQLPYGKYRLLTKKEIALFLQTCNDSDNREQSYVHNHR